MLWHKIQWRDCSQTEWIREDNNSSSSSSSKAIPHYLVKQLTNVLSTPSITSCCRWCSGAAKGIHSITFCYTQGIKESKIQTNSKFLFQKVPCTIFFLISPATPPTSKRIAMSSAKHQLYLFVLRI